jgi:hypothetical protein
VTDPAGNVFGDDIGEGAWRAAHLAFASLGFADGPAWWSDALRDWVEAMEPVADLETFDVVADADLRRLRWRVTGPVGNVAPRADRWFEHLGLDGGERAAVVAQAFGVASVGCWVDVSVDTMLSGWDVDFGQDGDPGTDAFDALPESPQLLRLWNWCDEQRVPAVLKVGMLAGSDHDVDIAVALPGRTIDEQMAAGLALFDLLYADPPTDDLVGLVAALGRPRLSARLSLTGDGVAWVAIASTEPSTDLVLTAIDAAGVGDEDDLAAFEGALGVTDRSRIEIVQAPTPTVRLAYRLS